MHHSRSASPPRPVPPCTALPCPPLQAVEQVAFADRILLNKIDLVDEPTKQAVLGRVKVGGRGGVLCLCVRGVERERKRVGGWVWG